MLLKQYLEEAFALVGSYILMLEGSSRPLPRRLWAGSSGIIWIRMLEEAVLRLSGNVTGFDHAEGADFDEGCKFGFTELQTVNKFITFNRYTAGNFRRAAEKYNFTGIMPEIEFLQSSDTQINTVASRFKSNREIASSSCFAFTGGSDFGLYPALGPVQGINFNPQGASHTCPT